MLQQWTKRDFDADYDPARQPILKLEDLPINEQPAMLIRLSTWPMILR
jgi:hypothetical protein